MVELRRKEGGVGCSRISSSGGSGYGELLVQSVLVPVSSNVSPTLQRAQPAE